MFAHALRATVATVKPAILPGIQTGIHAGIQASITVLTACSILGAVVGVAGGVALAGRTATHVVSDHVQRFRWNRRQTKATGSETLSTPLASEADDAEFIVLTPTTI